jgi:hypothetical protein
MEDFMGEALNYGLISLKFEGFLQNNWETPDLDRPPGRSDAATWPRW